MENMGFGTYSALGRLSGLFFFGLVILGINLEKTYPTAVLVTSVLLLMSGLPTCIGSLLALQKYKDVFDFEPTVFWGKQRNGKYARQTLTAFTFLGLWCSLAGLALIMITLV